MHTIRSFRRGICNVNDPFSEPILVRLRCGCAFDTTRTSYADLSSGFCLVVTLLHFQARPSSLWHNLDMDSNDKKRTIEAVDSTATDPAAQRQRTGEPGSTVPAEDWLSRDYVPDGLQKRDVPADVRRVWCTLRGDFTGDMWHCFAAEILWEYQRSPNDASYVAPLFSNHRPCTGLQVWGYNALKAKSDKESESCGSGRRTHNYARSIGLALPIQTVGSQPAGSNSWARMANASTAKGFNDANLEQGRRPADEQDFDSIVTAGTNALSRKKLTKGKIKPRNDPDMFSLWCSTSIVGQLMQNLGVANAQKILGHRFSLGLTDEMKQVCDDRIAKLKSTIADVQREQDVQKVVLLTYRKGDINAIHDTNSDLMKQIKETTKANKIGLITTVNMWSKYKTNFPEGFLADAELPKPKALATAAGGDIGDDATTGEDDASVQAADSKKEEDDDEEEEQAEEKEDEEGNEEDEEVEVPAQAQPQAGDTDKNYYFDVLGLKENNGLDSEKRMQAYIWHTIANTLQIDPEHPDADPGRCIIGIMGGRSGSMDMPAMVGMNALSWDSPILTTDGVTAKADEMLTTAFIDKQAPQMLRLINQADFMSVCYLDLAGMKIEEVKHKGRWTDKYVFAKLKVDDLLEGWLDPKARRAGYAGRVLPPAGKKAKMVSPCCRRDCQDMFR